MVTNYTGITDNQLAPLIGRLLAKRPGQALVISPSLNGAKRIASDLRFFTEQRIFVLPETDPASFRYEARSRSDLVQVLAALSALASGEPVVVVAPVLGALRKLAPRDVFERDVVRLCIPGFEDSSAAQSSNSGSSAAQSSSSGSSAAQSAGSAARYYDTFDRGDLIARLARMGYERMPAAEAFGQFAVRGDIIDVFPPGFENPVRIEFFDDEIDSIRSYDALTQRSVENLDTLTIYPAELIVRGEEENKRGLKKIAAAYRGLTEQRDYLISCIEDGINTQYLEGFSAYFYEQPGLIFNYLTDPSFVLADDPSRIAEALDFYSKEQEELRKQVLERKTGVLSDFESHPDPLDLEKINTLKTALGAFWTTPFAQAIRFAPVLDDVTHIEARQAPVYAGHMDVLETDLRRFAKNGYRITIACSTPDRLVNLKDFLQRIGLDGKVELKDGSLISGTEFPADKELYLSEADIFASAKKKRRKHAKGQEIKAFTDIKKGDYVVHESHGVGRFTGVEKLTVDGSTMDYLRIQYAGADVLYVPVDQMENLQKYVGSEGIEPKINKLSGPDWQITKAKAKAAIKDMAEDFLKLSAQRQLEPGFEFGPDSAWQREFEDAFPYQETDDQLRCAEEIKKDMESPRPMDRLLCGDVGYGKTEVAARAIFKCLEAGKQAAVLVPTTILANQHYHTFKDRFAPYPFNVEMLSRFRTAKEQDDIVEKLATGEVDLIVGTHRILSKDVKFKDLGLLVIDEEQRFGVEHKEAIKALKANVDVLTLSATPIPRTLHMSLIGVRDMSVIEEPPEDRYPVQTYVMEQDDALIADAVKRELGRGGQVYVVYNRVRGINRIADKIKELVPEANVCVAHGQMGERQLEDVMMDFTSGEHNVLVATTIIESGLDIPNVNTLIVLDSDRYGLSQLYQLRGRVGRSTRMAYAYLFYKKDKVLTEIATKRLRAIREFTEFGSGFRVAMRDLELRGAGNILGVEQSGHMVSVGYELYCKLVEEAVAELKGQTPEEKPISADTQVELGVSAFLPESYVADELTRLGMYKRISAIVSDDDRLEAEGELLDRFGDLPQEAQNLLDIAMIRNRASRAGIARLVQQQSRIVVLFERRNVLGPEAFGRLMDLYGPRLTIYGGVDPRISLTIGKGEKVLKTALKLVDALGVKTE